MVYLLYYIYHTLQIYFVETNPKYFPATLNEKLTSTFSLFCSTLGTGGGS